MEDTARGLEKILNSLIMISNMKQNFKKIYRERFKQYKVLYIVNYIKKEVFNIWDFFCFEASYHSWFFCLGSIIWVEKGLSLSVFALNKQRLEHTYLIFYSSIFSGQWGVGINVNSK